MKNKPSKARRGRQVPLDHLRPGGRDRAEQPTERAEPAEPLTPGGGVADAVRGKATRSPASVAERPHLEGSEQGPS